MLAVARERVAELPGVRVLAADGGRLAIDVHDTGRDAPDVAAELAARGIAPQVSSERMLWLAFGREELDAGLHERLAPALLIALWSAPVRRAGSALELAGLTAWRR